LPAHEEGGAKLGGRCRNIITENRKKRGHEKLAEKSVLGQGGLKEENSQRVKDPSGGVRFREEKHHVTFAAYQLGGGLRECSVNGKPRW